MVFLCKQPTDSFMVGEILILRFKENMAFLTEEVALNFMQVPVEIGGKTVKKFRAPAFWTIRVINYIPHEKRLFVDPIKYEVGDALFPPNQIRLAGDLVHIERITFKSIDTGGLLGTVNGT